MLTATFDELASLSEEEMLEFGYSPKAISVWGACVLNMSWIPGDAWDRGLGDASFHDLLGDIDLAYKKLDPLQDRRSLTRDRIVETTEAALLLARTSARLLHLIANTVQDNASPYVRLLALPKLGKLGQPLVDAWLEGAAETKRLLDVANEDEKGGDKEERK